MQQENPIENTSPNTNLNVEQTTSNPIVDKIMDKPVSVSNNTPNTPNSSTSQGGYSRSGGYQQGYSQNSRQSADRGYDKTGAGGQGARTTSQSGNHQGSNYSGGYQGNRQSSGYQGQGQNRGGSQGGRPGARRDDRSRGANTGDRRQNRREKEAEVQQLDNKVIDVRRVTRVVKGGKRMRFSALVVVGDRNGKVGFAIKKGLDYQDAVAKATKKATSNLIKVELNSDFSLKNIVQMKYKACEIYLKPAKQGTGLIAGGYVRPVLELAGVQNVYSKVIRSRNKIAGVQAVFEALKDYKKEPETKIENKVTSKTEIKTN